MKTLKLMLAIFSIGLFLTQCDSASKKTPTAEVDVDIEEKVSPDEICQWRGPNRDGIYPETNLLSQWPEKGPEVIWFFTFPLASYR